MKEINNYIKKLNGPIIVFGASGFIGSCIFRKIYSVRKDVFALTKNGTNWRLKNFDDSNIFTIDVNDENQLKLLFDKIRVRTIFDCVSYGAYSFEGNESLIYETNFTSLHKILKNLKKEDLSAYIHAGSSSEYGLNSDKPKEYSKMQPNSEYSVSKIAANALIEYYGVVLSLPIINLRLYSVYGPYEDPARLIPNLVVAGLKKKYPNFVNKDISRDFIYIDDVVNAFIMAAYSIKPKNYGQSFNVGFGKKTTIEELAYTSKNIFKIDKSPTFGNRDHNKWDLINWSSNPNKFKKEFDWIPLVDLDSGLKLTSEWIKKNRSHYTIQLSKSKKKERKSVSAIIACFKDAEAINEMYERLKKVFEVLNIEYEIIFVNDSSPDDTEEIIKKISRNNSDVIGIQHSRNFGSQMAFRSGMEIARMDGVVLLDGDLQDPPELIESFYSKWNDGYDVVYGTRIKREMSFLSNILYKLFYRAFSYFSYINIPKDAGDFSLIDKKAVKWILECKEKDLFLRGLRAYVGFKQTGVEYFRPDRKHGKSTNNLLMNIEWAKRGIFSFSNAPMSFLLYFGFFLLFSSIVLSIYIVIIKIFNLSPTPPGLTLSLLGIILFGSFNIFAIGLIGEYISKILLEVKSRPGFIRKSLIKKGKVLPIDNII